MTQSSIREQIAELAFFLPNERIERVVRLESETLIKLSDVRSRATRSTDRFEHYADMLIIQELEARLEFLRGLKFDLVKAGQ